jgi:hypothetical protein
MDRPETLLSTQDDTTDTRLMLWQAVSAALFILWIFTFAFMYFGSQLSSWQTLGVLKQELVNAVQQLAQQQQAFSQRLQTLEQTKAKE